MVITLDFETPPKPSSNPGSNPGTTSSFALFSCSHCMEFRWLCLLSFGFLFYSTFYFFPDFYLGCLFLVEYHLASTACNVNRHTSHAWRVTSCLIPTISQQSVNHLSTSPVIHPHFRRCDWSINLSSPLRQLAPDTLNPILRPPIDALHRRTPKQGQRLNY